MPKNKPNEVPLEHNAIFFIILVLALILTCRDIHSKDRRLNSGDHSGSIAAYSCKPILIIAGDLIRVVYIANRDKRLFFPFNDFRFTNDLGFRPDKKCSAQAANDKNTTKKLLGFLRKTTDATYVVTDGQNIGANNDGFHIFEISLDKNGNIKTLKSLISK